jgi:hypothetical protein
VLGLLFDLMTERDGMSGAVPLSKIWAYMDRYALPDWMEPVMAKGVRMMRDAFDKGAA